MTEPVLKEYEAFDSFGSQRVKHPLADCTVKDRIKLGPVLHDERQVKYHELFRKAG